MKRFIRSFSGIILSLLIILGAVTADRALTAHADSVDVYASVSSSSVRIGQSVDVTISVNGSSLSAYTMYISYSSDILEYAGSSGTVGGGGGTLTASGSGPGSVTISFTAIANGTAYVSTSGDEFYDINYEVLGVSHAGVSVTVETTENQTTEDKEDNSEDKTETTTEKDERSDDCDLASLSISPGELSPSFSPDNTSYTVQLTENDESIAISAITNDEKATTSVSGANSLEKGANFVTVTVTAENGAIKVYNLTVMCGEETEDIMLQVQGRNFIVLTEDLPDAPEGFTETTVKINDKDIPGFTAPNKRLNIICLKNEGGDRFWYIYDKDNSSFMPYNEVPCEKGRYVIMNKPDSFAVPNGFKDADLKIGNTMYKAFSDGTGSGIYLIYAMNLNGEAGYYLYDTREGSFMRFAAVESLIASRSDAEKVAPATVAPATEAPAPSPVVTDGEDTVKEENVISRGALKKLLIAMTVLFVIMCIAVIVLVIRNSNLMNKLDPDESADDADEKIGGETEAKTADTDKGAQQDAGKAEDEKEDLSKNKSYGVNDDTGEIQLEVASDFNSSVNVPLAKEEREDRIESAKKDRPFGIDSAFDVIPGEEPAAQVVKAALAEEKRVEEKRTEVKYTEVVEKPAKKVVLPGDRMMRRNNQ